MKRVELKKKNLRKHKLKNNHRKLLNVSMQLSGGVQDELLYEPQMEYEQELTNATKNSTYVREYVEYTKTWFIINRKK